ncbi:hypothetical protein HII31_07946, partial [Pseudocercospora fuligena]
SKHTIDLVTSESRLKSVDKLESSGPKNVFTIRVQWHLRLQASWRGLHPIGLYLPHEAIAVTAGILFAATNSATWLAYAILEGTTGNLPYSLTASLCHNAGAWGDESAMPRSYQPQHRSAVPKQGKSFTAWTTTMRAQAVPNPCRLRVSWSGARVLVFPCATGQDNTMLLLLRPPHKDLF